MARVSGRPGAVGGVPIRRAQTPSGDRTGFAGDLFATQADQTVSAAATVLVGGTLTVTQAAQTTTSMLAQVLPNGWKAVNLVPDFLTRPGAVYEQGIVNYNSGTDTWTIQGGGSASETTQDAGFFVYREFAGDVEISAKVTSFTATTDFAKAMVMVRNNETMDSSQAMLGWSPGTLTGPNKTIGYYRPKIGDSLIDQVSNGIAQNLPVWVKITRYGNTLTSYYSTDGINYTFFAAGTWAGASPVQIGFFVASHNDAASVTATFTNLSIVYVPYPMRRTLFADAGTPTFSAGDFTSYTLGTVFIPHVPGSVYGVRFYKDNTGQTGPHIASLWDWGSATELAQATFASEVLGWNQVLFTTPIVVTPDIRYVVSYTVPGTQYVGDSNYF